MHRRRARSYLILLYAATVEGFMHSGVGLGMHRRQIAGHSVPKCDTFGSNNLRPGFAYPPACEMRRLRRCAGMPSRFHDQEDARALQCCKLDETGAPTHLTSVEGKQRKKEFFLRPFLASISQKALAGSHAQKSALYFLQAYTRALTIENF